MPADYSDATLTRRVLCELLLGDRVFPLDADGALTCLEAARVQRLLPLIAWRSLGSDGLESWFGAHAQDLREEIQSEAIAEEIRTRELRDVLARLDVVSGAAPLVFKGAALAHSHYAESWLRPRLDTDILVSPASVPQALNALRAGGYQTETATAGELVSSQISLDRTDRFGISHVIDLHWQIANRSIIARVLPHADLAARAVPVPTLGPHARAASNADALTIACLHRAAHHRDSEDLLWLFDIHLIATRLSRREWDALVATADQGQVKSLLARGLELAMEWFTTPVPADVIGRLAGGAAEPSAVYLSKDIRLVDWLLADLRGLPWHKRGRLLVEHVVPPASYIREKYAVRSRRGLVLAYVKRALSGVPKWFVSGTSR